MDDMKDDAPPLLHMPTLNDFCDLRDALTAIKAERDEAQQQRARLLEGVLKMAEPCTWTQDMDGQWSTACGRCWEFINDGPKENRTDFCHGCGHPVRAVDYVDTITDEDEAAPSNV